MSRLRHQADPTTNVRKGGVIDHDTTRSDFQSQSQSQSPPPPQAPPLDMSTDDTNGDKDRTTTSSSSSSGSSSRVPFLDRLEHFTWAWYTLPMSTGGLALLLSEQTQPHTFHGLQTMGKVVYIWDLFLFTSVTAAISYRFTRFKGTLTASLTHPTEGLFFATFFLSMASIIAGMSNYGIPVCGPWLVVVYRVLFWIYFAVTFVQATAHYALLFTNPELRIEDMTPAWDLPIFPFMLSGTIAASGVVHQPADQAVPMIVAGVLGQGLGMMVSVLMYASYVRRMIQFGFPSPSSRPGMFIAVGPPSFTSLALIGMANNFPSMYHDYFGPDNVTVQVLRILATMTAIFIWSLSLWFFCVSVIANVEARKQLTFHLNWWAFVFPNVGLTIAVIDIGKTFRSQGVMWVGSIMTILLVATYLCVLVAHVLAVLRWEILWEGKDEDVYVKERKHKAERLHREGKIEQAKDLEKGKAFR